MKHNDFQSLIHLAYTDGKFIPTDISICNDLIEGEIITLKHIQTRDLSMHKCYFALLNYIWKWMPKKFQSQVPSSKFYKWLQTLKKEYKVLFTFADGSEMIEYESISFARMDEYKFRIYVKEQLPFINENLINKLFDEETASNIIEDIEKEFEKYFTKLFAVKQL